MKGLWLLVGAVLTLPSSFAKAEESLIFADRFDGGLAEDWSWLREDPDNWRIRDGALEIRVEPGVADNVKNALLCKAPITAREQSRWR